MATPLPPPDRSPLVDVTTLADVERHVAPANVLLDAVRFSPEQRLILEMHALRAAVQVLHNEMIELKLQLAPLPALLDELKRLAGEQSV